MKTLAVDPSEIPSIEAWRPATMFRAFAGKIHLVRAEIARCGKQPSYDGWDYCWSQSDIAEMVGRFGDSTKCQRCWRKS